MDGQPHWIGDLNDDCTAHWGNLMLRAGLLEAICIYPVPNVPVSGAPAAWSPGRRGCSLSAFDIDQFENERTLARLFAAGVTVDCINSSLSVKRATTFCMFATPAYHL